MAIETTEIDGYTVEIDYCPDTGSPRDDDSPGCQLVMWGQHYDFPNDADLDIKAYSSWKAVELELLDREDVLVTHPVWVYDHSGIALSAGPRTYPFNDRWDSAQCGVAYVTAKNWAETQGTEWTGSDEQRAQALKLIAGDVEVYGYYVNGETYGYRVLDADGEELTSCWGYYGWDAVTEAAREAAGYEAKSRDKQLPLFETCGGCGCEQS